MPWIGAMQSRAGSQPGSPFDLVNGGLGGRDRAGCRVARALTGPSCGLHHAVTQVRGVAALEDADQLELDRLGQVVEQVEEAPSRTKQDGDDVDLDLVELAGPDEGLSGPG